MKIFNSLLASALYLLKINVKPPELFLSMKHQFLSLNLDYIGFSASLLCAVHCAAIPFLFTLVPLSGLQVLSNPWIEYSIVSFSIIIALLSLTHGYRSHHHLKTPLILVLLGFGMIGVGHTLEGNWQETILTPLGAAMVAIAHMVNWKYVRRSQAYPEFQESHRTH
jgi:hypothetical protein